MAEFFLWNGRVNRLKYFLTQVVLVIGMLAINALAVKVHSAFYAVGVLYYMVYMYVQVVNSIKRFHDLDRPGIHVLLLFIPLYNIYIGLVLLFAEGTRGQNQYGPDPLGR